MERNVGVVSRPYPFVSMEIAIPSPNFLTFKFNPFPRSPFRLSPYSCISASLPSGDLKFNLRRAPTSAAARRRLVRDVDEEEEFGYNEEIALLETYTQLVKNEILWVHAAVDDEEVQVVIFKGFSSCLSYQTTSDVSKSVIPARAIITSVDRVKGPFDPSNVEYIEKGLTFHEIKNRLHSLLNK